MPSKARQSFDANVQDIKNLLAFHALVGGQKKGRRYQLEVLNKSAIVLITAYWEAYCEDIAAEALAHIVTHAKSAHVLPTELKKQLAKELKNAQHELEVWKIADGGWKTYLSERLETLRQKRNHDLNTPKSDQIDKLFLNALGIASMSRFWTWRKMNSSKAAQKLDAYVSLRGNIAHRGKDAETVRKDQVVDYFGFIKRLAGKTGGTVNKHVRSITKKGLWK
jgi:hypothetical protein